MEITVKKNHLRQSPNKIRPMLYLIKQQKAEKAMQILNYTNNKASRALLGLLKSAVAAAKEKEMKEDRLIVKNAKCDQASRLKRHVFKARGRTARITKRNSHISIILSDEANIEGKNKKLKKASQKNINDKKKKNSLIKPKKLQPKANRSVTEKSQKPVS